MKVNMIARPTIGVLAALALLAGWQWDLADPSAAATKVSTGSTPARYAFTRAGDPARTIVRDSGGAWVATFTDGARSVALKGPSRRFSEVGVASRVTSTTWVRVLPEPFAGQVDVVWLTQARANATPDVLATSMKFLAGSPDAVGPDGSLLAADASYGPLQPDGTREAGSDWNDFQGITATYSGEVDAPEPAESRSLDCSGFVRMLWGRRFGIPLGLRPDEGKTLPRRAAEQADAAPGAVPVAASGTQVKDLGRLQPGDLTFFDASTDDGTAIDHVGIYLGVDAGGHHRFISSRRSADGPTMGDLRGASVLDGSGLYARSFRSTRRL